MNEYQQKPIVFLGSPEFAVPSLEQLVMRGFNIRLVITNPDRPARRGRRLAATPIKVLAERNGLNIYQPLALKQESVRETIANVEPAALVLVAYGKLVPKPILELPPYGAINLHPSLLPKHRGASPIQWALMQGEASTGVTTMYMNEGLDTGDIIYQERTVVKQGETCGELSARLSVQGAQLLEKTVKDVLEGTAPRRPQDNRFASSSRLLKREDERLAWDMESVKVAGWILALSPKPGAYTYHKGRRVKLLRARVAQEVPGSQGQTNEKPVPGEVLEIISDRGIIVAARAGSVLLEEVQPENRPRMHAFSYANGYGLHAGDIFKSAPA